jgi:hypothetical protein
MFWKHYSGVYGFHITTDTQPIKGYGISVSQYSQLIIYIQTAKKMQQCIKIYYSMFI